MYYTYLYIHIYKLHIGPGNRRIFVLFTTVASIGCVLQGCMMAYTEYYILNNKVYILCVYTHVYVYIIFALCDVYISCDAVYLCNTLQYPIRCSMLIIYITSCYYTYTTLLPYIYHTYIITIYTYSFYIVQVQLPIWYQCIQPYL